MNKTTFYIVIIILLIILNGIFGFMLFNRPSHGGPMGPPNPEGPKKIIIEKLDFSENQIEQFDELIEEHRNLITQKEEGLRTLKNELYGQLLVDEESQKVNEISEKIGAIHVEIEHIHFQHFEDIKKICTQDQLDDYSDLVKELGMLFAPHNPPHPPKK